MTLIEFIKVFAKNELDGVIPSGSGANEYAYHKGLREGRVLFSQELIKMLEDGQFDPFTEDEPEEPVNVQYTDWEGGA